MTNFHFRLQYDVVTLHSEEAAVVAGDPYREAAVGGSCSVPCSRITALECCADSGVIANKAEIIISSWVVPRLHVQLASLHDLFQIV